MPDIPLLIEPETPADAEAIERLNERVFGPGRFAKTAYRLREEAAADPALSFVARVGTMLVGANRMTPILIGDTPALLLGPLTVEPAFRERGVGQALIERALKEAKAKGHRLVILVGDEAYYGKSGFKRVPPESATMPGPVDPARLLVAELEEGAFEGVSGPIRPD
jgi:predicted N-acetyltransferase YhbS